MTSSKDITSTKNYVIKKWLGTALGKIPQTNASKKINLSDLHFFFLKNFNQYKIIFMHCIFDVNAPILYQVISQHIFPRI